MGSGGASECSRWGVEVIDHRGGEGEWYVDTGAATRGSRGHERGGRELEERPLRKHVLSCLPANSGATELVIASRNARMTYHATHHVLPDFPWSESFALLYLFLSSFSFLTKNTMHAISSSSSRAARRVAAKAVRPTILARGAHKEIKFSNEGRASILKGVDVLANAVSVTLGPKGKSWPYLCIVVTDRVVQVATSSSNSPLAVPRLPRVSLIFTRIVSHTQ